MIGTLFARLLFVTTLLCGLFAALPSARGVSLPFENPGVGDYNGTRVDISGNTIIVGGFGHGATYAGWAQTFVYSGEMWAHEQTLQVSGTSYSYFGYGVGIDGDTAVIGAYGSNKAYVFGRSSGSWSETGQLSYAGATNFGFDTRIDGDHVIVGTETGNAAFIFNNDGGWDEGQSLPASGMRRDFGYSVDISGGRAVVGDYSSNTVHFYCMDGDSWVEEDTVTRAGAQFGYSVAIDGDYAIVGDNWANSAGGSRDGAAYIYHRQGNDTDGYTWELEDTGTLHPNTLITNDNFGTSVDISGDYAVVGAVNQGPLGARAGSAYVFERSGDDWYLAGKLTPPGGATDDQFGNSVAIDSGSGWVAVGAWFENSCTGGAYAFEIPSLLPGDANLDGCVDAADVSIMAANWGMTGTATWAQGDFSGDYCIDQQDAKLLAQHWGTSPLTTGEALNVPEPGVGILLLGLVLLGFFRRFR